MYKYKCIVKRVVDGDTIDTMVDLGFDVFTKQRFRLFGVDTPESRTRKKEEKKRGLEVKAFVKDAIENKVVYVTSEERGKFGRFLATVYYESKEGELQVFINLNKQLIDLGMAKEYFGGKKTGWNY